jgi:saccharopine dehydrogenase (NAD+, L-lysine-forming)
MPLDMVEIKALPQMFGLSETGVFAAGFNWFIDYLIFPFMMLSQKVKKGSLRHFWSRMFIFGMNKFSSAQEGVVFLLNAEGNKDGRQRMIEMISDHENGYEFTVIPVIACLKQYLDGSIRKAGLWMMGHIVKPDRLLSDMEKMNIKIQTKITDKDAI